MGSPCYQMAVLSLPGLKLQVQALELELGLGLELELEPLLPLPPPLLLLLLQFLPRVIVLGRPLVRTLQCDGTTDR